MKPLYHVVVIETKTGNLESRFDVVTSLRKKKKIERGININLDHANFHTEIWEQV